MEFENLKTVENFDSVKLKQIYEDSKTTGLGKNLRKDLTDCIMYLYKTVFPLKDGKATCVFRDGKLEILDNEQFGTLFYNRYPCKELKDWFKFSPDVIYFTLSSAKSDFIVDYKSKKVFNSPKIKATYKPYESFSESAKEGCQLLIKHIQNINCGGDAIQSKYLLKCIKNMCLGVKNNICVVIRGAPQGTGKSTFIKHIETHVIGRENVCIGTTNMVVKGFNYPMYGKLMVKFEELPCFSKEQFKGVSGKFKEWITEDFIAYEDKGKPQFESSNCHTMFILSNNDCIDDDDGRRYFILDHELNEEIIDDEIKKKKYFDTLYSKAFTDEVGNCFYSYLIDKVPIEDKFDPNSAMPMTKNKISSKAQKLDKPLLFIKQNYVLKQIPVSKRLRDLHTEYTDERKWFKMTPETFNKKLRDSELRKYISDVGGYPKLRIQADELLDLYKRNNWMSEMDIFDKDINVFDDEPVNNIDYPFGKAEDNTDYKSMFLELQKKYDELKKQLEPKIEEVVIVKPKPNPVIEFDSCIDDLEAELESLNTQETKPSKPSIKSQVQEVEEEYSNNADDIDLFTSLIGSRRREANEIRERNLLMGTSEPVKKLSKPKSVKPKASLTLEL